MGKKVDTVVYKNVINKQLRVIQNLNIKFWSGKGQKVKQKIHKRGSRADLSWQKKKNP